MAAARQSSPSKPARKRATRRRLKPAAAIAARVQDMVEHELLAVERVLAALQPSDAGEAERTARTLASLARALRELSRVTPVHTAPEAEASDNDDAVPRDLDEFRRELARRIDAFVGAQADGGIPDDPDGGVERGPVA